MRALAVLGICAVIGCDGGSDGEETATGETGTTTPTTDTATGTTTPTGTHAAVCEGPHAGSFAGDLTGTLDGTLQANGVILVSFDTEIGPINAAGYIDEAGVVTGGQQGVTIEGTYDFTACAAIGTWTDANLGLLGTWEASRQ
jgi:hypothetical protein